VLAFDDRAPRAFAGALIAMSADDGMGLLHSRAPGGCTVEALEVFSQNAVVIGVVLMPTAQWLALSPYPIDTPVVLPQVHVERGPIASEAEFGSGPDSPLANTTPQGWSYRTTTQVPGWRFPDGRGIHVPFGWTLLTSTRTVAAGTGWFGVNFQWTEHVEPDREMSPVR